MLIRVFIFWTILLVSCGYALWQGRKYERIAAIVFLTATVVSVAGHLILRTRYVELDITDALVDTAVLLAVIAIALVSDRFWPLWIAGLQLVGSTAHVLRLIEIDLPAWGYAIAARFWSYPILIILFIGAWRQRQRALVQPQPSLA